MPTSTYKRWSSTDVQLYFPVATALAVTFFILWWHKFAGLDGWTITKKSLSIILLSAFLGWLLSYLISVIRNTVVLWSRRQKGSSYSFFDFIKCGFGSHPWTNWKYVEQKQCEQIRSCPVCKEQEHRVQHQLGEFHYLTYATLEGLGSLQLQIGSLITERLNMADLGDFCFIFDQTDIENLAGDSKNEKVNSLLRKYNQHKKIPELLNALARYRPEIADELKNLLDPEMKMVPEIQDQHGYCLQIAVCQRCGFKEEKTEHLWNVWSYPKTNSCLQVRDCRRCNIKEEKILHQWGPETYDSTERCDSSKTCIRCGEQENLGERHIYQQVTERAPDGKEHTFNVCIRCGDKN